MKRTKTLTGCVLAGLLAVTMTTPVLAEDDETERGAYARNLAFVGDRVEQLAEAIPEEHYDWRPMEGVRSVQEAIMHIAGANYFFANRLGTPPPEGVDPRNMEEITDKAKVLEALEASNEHMMAAFDAVEDPSAATEFFGREGTVEDLMLIAIGHVHEHFGQLIAYARSNGVVPPWSQTDG